MISKERNDYIELLNGEMQACAIDGEAGQLFDILVMEFERISVDDALETLSWIMDDPEPGQRIHALMYANGRMKGLYD